MKRISVPVWKCQRCLYEWVPRKKNGKPAECPNCKRRDWNKQNLAGAKKPVWKCQKCLHEWVSRKKSGKPVECPNCKRRGWNKRNLAGSKKVTVKVPPLYPRN